MAIYNSLNIQHAGVNSSRPARHIGDQDKFIGPERLTNSIWAMTDDEEITLTAT